VLNKKITVITKFKKNQQIPLGDLVFYKKYSNHTIRIIKNESFLRFIKYLLKKEEISESKIVIVKVRVFPFKNESGQCVIGNCNRRGEIKIFPKKRSLCLQITSRFGRKTFFSYIAARAKAALIHELLHIKYLSNEKKVRTLTKQYFEIYDQNRILPSATRLLFL
jgi:hypothetical protein